MSALVERIRTRINQVEQRANAAIEDMRCACHPHVDFSRWKYRDGEAVVLDDATVHAVAYVHHEDRGLGRHFEINDPYLALARVKGNRKILDLCAEIEQRSGRCAEDEARWWLLSSVLDLLAESYDIEVAT